jgi:hypothetical protein
MQTDRHRDRRTDRQTDRYDEANGHFSNFCERAKKKLLVFLNEGRSHYTYVADVLLEKDASLVSTIKIQRTKLD